MNYPVLPVMWSITLCPRWMRIIISTGYWHGLWHYERKNAEENFTCHHDGTGIRSPEISLSGKYFSWDRNLKCHHGFLTNDKETIQDEQLNGYADIIMASGEQLLDILNKWLKYPSWNPANQKSPIRGFHCLTWWKRSSYTVCRKVKKSRMSQIWTWIGGCIWWKSHDYNWPWKAG